MKFLKIFGFILALGSFIFFGCPGDINDLNSVSSVDNIVGTWHAVLDEGDIQQDYQVEITKSADADSVINISNFFNNSASAYAIVKDLEITVPTQTVGNRTIEGTGTISSDYQQIVWNITADGDKVTITFTPGTVTKYLYSK